MKADNTVSHLSGSALQIGYGDHVIVSDMDVDIRNDRITTIIGSNGSGKSTVLKAITRLIRYQKGSVLLNGRDILEMKPKELACTIGVLPQVHSAPADFRVKELVSYGRMPHQKLLSGPSGISHYDLCGHLCGAGGEYRISPWRFGSVWGIRCCCATLCSKPEVWQKVCSGHIEPLAICT